MKSLKTIQKMPDIYIDEALIKLTGIFSKVHIIGSGHAFDEIKLMGSIVGKISGKEIGPSEMVYHTNNLSATRQLEKKLSDKQWDKYCKILGGTLRACAHAGPRERSVGLLFLLQEENPEKNSEKT